MNRFGNHSSIAELLDHCSDPASKHWQSGWGQLLGLYKKFIYNAILKRCLKFNIQRLNRDLNEAVEDILNDVLINICKNNCKALKEFRGRDNETIFLAWLAKICNMTAYSYVNKYYLVPIYELSLEDIKEYIGNIDSEMLPQMYEEHVQILRSSRKRSKNMERDINIYKLYLWEDFTYPMFKEIPCLKGIGHRVVDNVVHRIRSYLKENSNPADYS